MEDDLENKYEESRDLNEAARYILGTVPEHFQEVLGVKYSIFFSLKDSPVHFAGQCERVSDKLRFKTGIDYIILVYKDNFLRSGPEDQLKILIHELHHILVDERGNLRLRRHNEQEDFCELPSHDKYSERVLAELMAKVLVES